MHVLLKAILLNLLFVVPWFVWFAISFLPCQMIWLVGMILGLNQTSTFWKTVGEWPMAPWYYLMYVVRTRYLIKYGDEYICIEKSRITGEYHLMSLRTTNRIDLTEHFPSRRAAEKLRRKLEGFYTNRNGREFVIVKERIR